MNFGKNIKKIRVIKKLSQSAFAELFDMKRSSIGAYEEGRAEPKLEVIIRIANHFSISIDSLVNSDITVNELSHFKLLDDYLSGKPAEKSKATDTSLMGIVPIVIVQDLFVEELSELRKESKQQISLPALNEKQMAIVYSADDFLYSPKGFQKDDLLVIKAFESKVLDNESYFLLKHKNDIMLGELRSTGKLSYIFITPDQDIIDIKKAEIQKLFVVEKHIVNHLVVVDDALDKIKKLERLVNDLYHRIE